MNDFTIDRTVRPSSSEVSVTPFPEFATFTLGNGLRVYHVSDPRPTVTLRLLVPGGSAADGTTPGCADMVADMLTKGSNGTSAQDFAGSIDFLGGHIGASASVDSISVSANGLKSRIIPILELFASVVTAPDFDEDELAKMKKMVIEGIAASKSEIGYVASEAVARLLYKDSPLGAMPSEESINEIDRDALEEYYDEFFSPRTATVAVVGNYETDELQALLEEYLGSWEGEEVVNLPERRFVVEGGRLILVDRPSSVQSAIRIVGPGPFPNDEEFARTQILGDIIGGGTGLGNRLTTNLRETHGWTYSPRAGFPSNRHAGRFTARAEVSSEVTDQAVREMLFELDRLTHEEVSSEELELNIRSTVGRYLMSLANPTLTARRVQHLEFYDMSPSYYDDLVDHYRGTTQSDIKNLASRFFDRSRLSIIIVGKASEIADSLQAYGEVELWDTDLNPVERIRSGKSVGGETSDTHPE